MEIATVGSFDYIKVTVQTETNIKQPCFHLHYPDGGEVIVSFPDLALIFVYRPSSKYWKSENAAALPEALKTELEKFLNSPHTIHPKCTNMEVVELLWGAINYN